jgi:protein-disulfide isomerase
MPISRRTLLAVGGLTVGGGVLSPAAWAQTPPATTDPRMADRALGKTDAPVSVMEWFSLTCPHCAAFHRDTFPQVRAQLIDTGKLRMVFKDFPLDQVALMAAQVARSLPPERYEPFCAALFASQDRWAFARGVNSKEELAKMAALAGLARPAFDAAVGDDGLKAAILAVQDQGDKFYHVDSTPSFIFNGPAEKDHREAGERTYDEFAKLVSAAAG